MELKSRFVQLCIDVSIWNMVVILELGRIQVKGEIVRIMTRIHHKGRRNFKAKNGHAQGVVHSISQLIL